MSKTPRRTRPLDRDGDGKDGGSLPGNQTAPLAEATGADTALSDVASPSETPPEASDIEAVPAASEAAGDDRDDPHVECIRCAESHPEGVLQDDLCPACVDEEDAHDLAQTFTPDQIAAGQTPVVEQEGETVARAADAPAVFDPADPVSTVETQDVAVAVRLSELSALTGAVRLYKSDLGYSALYAAPFIDHATVDGWVRAGLALPIPSAGHSGGVRATEQARDLVRRLRAGAGTDQAAA